MSEEQGQFAAPPKTSGTISGQKDRKTSVNLVDLILIRPDFAELVQLFQNLQDVEIFIDDQPILTSAQLEQFAEDYQATTVRARGYWPEIASEQGAGQGSRRLVELAIGPMLANISGWKSLEKTVFMIQLRKLLLRRVNFRQGFMQGCLLFSLISPGYAIVPIIIRQPFDSAFHILFIVFEFIAAVLISWINIFLVIYTFTRLRLTKRNHLLPGKITEPQTNQQKVMIIRILISMLFLIILSGFMIVGFTIAARLWW